MIIITSIVETGMTFKWEYEMKTSPVVSIPQPHAAWGLPTATQLRYLEEYIAGGQPMSIYGDSGIYRDLEQYLCNYYGSNFCVLTNTGTSSLSSGYFGLDIRPGDEVIVPTYTFLATVTPLLRLGASIVFCDSDSNTGNISPVDLERKISHRTKVVAITHMWGVPCDMDALLPLIRNAGSRLLEDCSHSQFTRYKGRLTGTFGDVACASIGAKKTITSGEGGFLLTSDPEIFARATLLGHFDLRAKEALETLRGLGHSRIADKYSRFTIGYGENYRMHPYSTALAFALFKSGEAFEIIKRRGQSLRYFADGLKSFAGIQPPIIGDDYYTGAMYGFKPRLNSKSFEDFAALVAELKDRNVSVKIPDSMPLHDHPVFPRSSSSGSFSGVHQYLRGRVSMPTFSGGLPFDKALIDEYLTVISHVCKG